MRFETLTLINRATGIDVQLFRFCSATRNGPWMKTRWSAVRRWFRTFFFVIALMVTPASFAGISLQWDASVGLPVAGYRLYMGRLPHIYTEAFEAGRNTFFVTPTLKQGAVYYFAVTAYDSFGLESDFSNELRVKYISELFDVLQAIRAEGIIIPVDIETILDDTEPCL